LLIRRLWAFFAGYVVITVDSRRLEKFLNLALARNIPFWDVSFRGRNGLTMKVSMAGFKPLRHIARQTDSSVRIKSKNGCPFFWLKIKKRKMLAVGLLFFLTAIYFFSTFVWFVDLQHREQLKYLSEEEIMKEIYSMGLRPGVPNWNFNLREMEKELAVRLPELSWVGVTLEGTKATVEIVEKTLPPEDEGAKHPANVIASKDGVVEEILVIVGEAMAKEGDAVSAGEVLISGIIYPKQEETLEDPNMEQVAEPRIVHAKGVVKARVWFSAVSEMPIIEKGERPTGSASRQVSIKAGGKQIIIRGPKENPYQYYQVEQTVKRLPAWRSIKLPVELITTNYYEMEKYQINRGAKAAESLAAAEAKKVIEKQLPAGAKVLDKRTELLEKAADYGTVKVRVTYEVLENIAQTRLLKR